MAQQNRRRARKGGTAKPGNGRPENGRPENGRQVGPDQEFRELESGEEQLTEAQMAFGRPELAETPNAEELTAFEESQSGRDYAPAEPSASAGALSTRPASTRRRRADHDVNEVEHRAVRQNPVLQLVGFAKGSFRELQRVQWPDRRQVFQATGVVLGFVIVAGAFLGGASWAAQKIVNLILYGHG